MPRCARSKKKAAQQVDILPGGFLPAAALRQVRGEQKTKPRAAKRLSCSWPRLSYGQWICHSPNVMKTDIFAAIDRRESGKSTQGSIRFDSLSLRRSN